MRELKSALNSAVLQGGALLLLCLLIDIISRKLFEAAEGNSLGLHELLFFHLGNGEEIFVVFLYGN